MITDQNTSPDSRKDIRRTLHRLMRLTAERVVQKIKARRPRHSGDKRKK